ncbi:Hypothetical predicted protein [Olea europaea subsp. europaea]|uniref:Uncharacterized protein n=1 Tax=Olea europaea subsp. europaea TaxID=158383 RepID=A0A8S0RCX7_OLEEU|nr:Hypothetical predicted protein [Olea europaea subsp. europaea]
MSKDLLRRRPKEQPDITNAILGSTLLPIGTQPMPFISLLPGNRGLEGAYCPNPITGQWQSIIYAMPKFSGQVLLSDCMMSRPVYEYCKQVATSVNDNGISPDHHAAINNFAGELAKWANELVNHFIPGNSSMEQIISFANYPRLHAEFKDDYMREAERNLAFMIPHVQIGLKVGEVRLGSDIMALMWWHVLERS